MTPIKLLVIGAGSRGANYAEYAHWHPDQAQVVGVAEPCEHYRPALHAGLVLRQPAELPALLNRWRRTRRIESTLEGKLAANSEGTR